jgi:hypothetical protein
MLIAALAGNLAVIALLINMVSIPLLSPSTDWETTDRRPDFMWGGLHGMLGTGKGTDFIFMIDEDPEFSSPLTKEVQGNSYRPEEPLEFGTYYWKVMLPERATSPTGMFTVVSEVSVKRDQGRLTNTGNSGIALATTSSGREPAGSTRPGLTGLFLGVNQTVEIGGNEDVIARQW